MGWAIGIVGPGPGIDLPELGSPSRVTERTLLFLGRVHPKKGLDMLLPAWAAVQHKFPNWRLRIVGPDNRGYLDEMKLLAKSLGMERFEFTGPLTGAEKTHAYDEADLFVLPTYSENFGMTVAESLAAGTPAIVSKGAPWEGLEANSAGWWIDTGKDPLVACLEQALAQPRAYLDQMGLNGRLWMARDFSWEYVAGNLKTTYEWILSDGPCPEFVYLD